MTYEYASKKERAFYASIPQMGLATGLCLSSGVVALLSWALTNEQFLAWGWRLAFLVSVVLVCIALYIRMHILETPDFQKAQEKARQEKEKKTLPIVKVCREHPGNIALGVGARWIDGVFFNVLAVFVITYLVQYVNVPRTEALSLVMVSALVMCPFILIAGRLADRYGRGRVYGIASMLCGLSIFPSFWLMGASEGNLFMIGLAIIIPLSVFYAGVFGPEAALFSDLFPADVRYTGISIVYQFPGFLVAGIVPGLCTYFMKVADGDPIYVCLYTMPRARFPPSSCSASTTPPCVAWATMWNTSDKGRGRDSLSRKEYLCKYFRFPIFIFAATADCRFVWWTPRSAWKPRQSIFSASPGSRT